MTKNQIHFVLILLIAFVGFGLLAAWQLFNPIPPPMTKRIHVTTFDAVSAEIVETNFGKWIIVAQLTRHKDVPPYTHYFTKEHTWESGSSDRWDSEAEARAFAISTPPSKPEPKKLDLGTLVERLQAKYGDHVHRILTEFEDRADGQRLNYIDGLTVCHNNEIDGG